MPMKSIATFSLTTFLLATTLACAACETSKAERVEPASSPPAVSSLSQDQATGLIERAEQVRDRTFETQPKLEAVTSSDELPAAPEEPDQVAVERTLLLEQLFGQTSAPAEDALGTPTPAFSRLAGYDKAKHRVLYIQGDGAKKERAAAIVAALVQALDAEQFDALPTPTSWDEQLALQAARYATVSFALAQHLLETHHPDKAPDLLATRPELAAELPVLAKWLDTSGSTETFLTKLDARQEAFVLREGWTLAAALYRSSGWSGVELSRLMPPRRTADVVRPDEWMSGEGVGEWRWPSEKDNQGEPSHAGTVRAGKVGPGVTSMWLEDVVAPQLARTVYAGYISDAYRFFDERDDAPARFEWLSVWNSPDAARQVTAAFEKRLRRRFDDATDPTDHFVVFQKGLKVGVIISEAPDQANSAETKRERAQKLLEGHILTLMPRDALPTSYVPTRQDRLIEAMQAATMKKRQWVDPATRLRMDLSPLGDDWRVQQPDHGPVRWFASNPDGTLLQLTVELDNPFGPEFSSDAYRERLVEAFQSSLEQAKLEHVALTDKTPSRGLVVRLSGQVDTSPRTLQLWQFERDDLIVSYSLQAPPEAFDEHRELAESILDDARTIEAASQTDDAPADEPNGSIEYQVEE
jgi:hypothetical protein